MQGKWNTGANRDRFGDPHYGDTDLERRLASLGKAVELVTVDQQEIAMRSVSVDHDMPNGNSCNADSYNSSPASATRDGWLSRRRPSRS